MANAPYADKPIPLYLNSSTGMKYRMLNCLECGQEFLERQGDVMYRINDESQPSEMHISSDMIAKCGRCTQQYSVTLSMSVVYTQDGVPLHMQPQSIYLIPMEHKKLRYVHCLECGKTFHSISDRISNVVDNRVPFEYLNPSKLGPIEALCSWNRCGQTWSFVL